MRHLQGLTLPWCDGKCGVTEHLYGIRAAAPARPAEVQVAHMLIKRRECMPGREQVAGSSENDSQDLFS